MERHFPFNREKKSVIMNQNLGSKIKNTKDISKKNKRERLANEAHLMCMPNLLINKQNKICKNLIIKKKT